MKKSFIAILIFLAGMFLVVAGVTLLSNSNQHPLPSGTVADKVLVEKKARSLTLLKNGKTLKSYCIALGSNPTGKKLEEGDRRTPEGTYTIDRRKVKSSYHRALHVSYPNPYDIAQAKSRGVSPGGDIMIHG